MTSDITLKNLLNYGRNFLKSNNNFNNTLDAEILLSHALNVERLDLIRKNDDVVKKNNYLIYFHYLNRRKNNEPIAYITSKKEFWDFNFFVQKSVLIPRPETELLIENILKIKKNKNFFYHILEIGTGCGCVIISLLKELKFSRGIGIEKSKKAFQISKKNSELLQVNDRLKLYLADLEKFKTFQKFDIIVSNPPYIPEYKIKNLSEDIKRFEPNSALVGGKFGYEYVEKIIRIYSKFLKINGILALEIGDNQFKNINEILRKNGLKVLIKSVLINKQVRNVVAVKL